MVQPLHIKNAYVWDGRETVQRDLYTSAGGRIIYKPANGAHVVDLDGYSIFPGLINAHDHLELNHYPRSKFRERYDNAHQWGEDMNVRLDTEPYKSLRAYPLEDKLFIGGLKNLLCGATTVAHHNPLHKYLKWDDFPVDVLQKYGWSHSLHFDTEDAIYKSYRRTPKHVSWFIHLAEGTDAVTASEYQRLKALGCVGENTVIVHGVGLTAEDTQDAVENVRGLVWCPSTNLYLLDETTPFVKFSYDPNRPTWRDSSHVALGSDSRLTADGDLLAEMTAAKTTSQCDWGCVLEAVTHRAAHILGLNDIGHLNPGAKAHWIAGFSPQRADLTLIVHGGVPQIGDPDMMAKFPHVKTVPAMLDSRPKAIHRKLAERIWKCTLKESGLEIDEPPKRKYLIF